MNKRLLLFALIACIFTMPAAFGQTVVLDFEGPTTTTNFQYFGSSLDGSLTSVIANPNATGVNTSANVVKYVKPANSQVWAGAFSNPNPATAVDGVANSTVCVKVHMDHIGNLAFKLENSATGDNWITTQSNTVINDWEELCFDLSVPSEEAPFTAAAGHIYPTIVVFFDFGSNSTDSAVYYFDDIVAKPIEAECNTILDFDSASTSTTFQIFGSSLDGSLTPIIANPAPDAVNSSDSVVMYVKAGDAQVWGGAFSNPNPATPVDFTTGGDICVMVHMSHIGSVTMKLENSTTGGDNWAFTLPNTVANAWEEICFSADSISIDPPNNTASGHVYPTVTFFIDLGTAGTGTNDTTYIDQFCVAAPAGPSNADVTFTVDMNSYAGSFTQPYVFGSFNSWDATANPLDDSDNDGIWSATVNVPTGPLEYKFTLDGGADEESFNGTEETGCTLKTDEFVNRIATISENTALDTVCYNSCYACGTAAMITINLGFGSVSPDSNGVWLAGGGNFDAPGGRFKMEEIDSSGVYTITFERLKGFNSYYTFSNGNCPDFSCKEDISGQSCADPNNFNDRFLNSVTQDTTILACFGNCDETSCVNSVGIDKWKLNEDLFSVAPTLVEHSTVISFNQIDGKEKHISVFNISGQMVLPNRSVTTESELSLNMSHLPGGLYYIQVRTRDQFATKKVLKQ